MYTMIYARRRSLNPLNCLSIICKMESRAINVVKIDSFAMNQVINICIFDHNAFLCCSLNLNIELFGMF